MKMTPGVVLVGSVLVFSASTFAVIVVPWMTMAKEPSRAWRELSPTEQAGRRVQRQHLLGRPVDPDSPGERCHAAHPREPRDVPVVGDRSSDEIVAHRSLRGLMRDHHEPLTVR